jgi:hypothetical protein
MTSSTIGRLLCSVNTVMLLHMPPHSLLLIVLQCHSNSSWCKHLIPTVKCIVAVYIDDVV